MKKKLILLILVLTVLAVLVILFVFGVFKTPPYKEYKDGVYIGEAHVITSYSIHYTKLYDAVFLAVLWQM